MYYVEVEVKFHTLTSITDGDTNQLHDLTIYL